MANWKKVIVSGSSANLAALQVDNLTSGQVIIGGGSSNLSTTAINGTGNIVATTGATGLEHSGSFSGSFQGNFIGLINSASYATSASRAEIAGQTQATLTIGEGLGGAVSFDGSTAVTLTVSGAADLSDNAITKWNNTDGKFANSSLTDNGTAITGTTSIQLTGANSNLSGSFSGSFSGNGSELTNIPAASITGLKLNSITSGSVTASVDIGTNAFVLVSGSSTLLKIKKTGAFENGSAVTASGDWSRAEGLSTQATGNYSYAQGNGSTAQGIGSHAEGQNTVAVGNYSHAEGVGGQAQGVGSHVEGESTTAQGNYAHAEGNSTQAKGVGSHAEGEQTVAIGSYSHAEGLGTISSGSYQLAVGKYNTQGNTGSLVVIGNGASGASRSDLALFNSTYIRFNAPVSASTFSGSFVGDGSGLTGLATTLTISGSTGGGTVSLGTQTLSVVGTANEIETSASGQTITIGLPDNVTVTGDLTVNGGGIISAGGAFNIVTGQTGSIAIGGAGSTITIGENLIVPGNLTVQGTTTILDTTNTAIKDQFVLLASGSTSTIDAGIIVQNAANAGEALYWENNPTGPSRWAIASNVAPTATTVAAAEYMVSAKTDTGAPVSAPTYGGSATGYGNIYVDSANGDIYIYS